METVGLRREGLDQVTGSSVTRPVTGGGVGELRSAVRLGSRGFASIGRGRRGRVGGMLILGEARSEEGQARAGRREVGVAGTGGR